MSIEQWPERWSKVKELGAGGQGTTYEVVSKTDPATKGVLKLLHDDIDVQARTRLAREALNLSALSQQNVKVPKLLDDNSTNYKDPSVQLYLVMEFVPGQTLNHVVTAQGGRFSLEQAAAIALDLCATTDRMHKVPILHRDLKPANLMVRDFGKADVVVLDLGLAFDGTADRTTVTRLGETIKNELLALPEATTPTGDRRDHRSDITNIVGVFFFCLTGRLPALLRDERNLAPHQRTGCRMQDVLHGDSRARQVELLLDCGFAVDIESRFQSIDELQGRLSQVLQGGNDKKRTPFQAAAELSARLRTRNRKLQVQDYVPCAKHIHQSFHRNLNGMNDKLGFFSVSFASFGGIDLGLPPGLDHVYSFTHDLVLKLQTVETTRVNKLCIAAKGDRCVLLRARFTSSVDHRNLIPPKRWEEIAWFDPAKLPENDEVKRWVDEVLITDMEEFEQTAGI